MSPPPNASLHAASAAPAFAALPTPMLTPRAGLGVVAVNGRVYAIGGDSGAWTNVEEYDPVGNAWVAKAAMPTARSSFALAAATNGRIYASGDPSMSLDEFTPSANSWVGRSPALTFRNAPLAVGHPNGKVYVIGGWSGLTTNEEYDPSADSWRARQSMTFGRAAPAGAVGSDGRIYVFGGTNGQNLDAAEAYDPLSNDWETLPSMPLARHAAAAVAFGDRILVFGGSISVPGGSVAVASTVVGYYDIATRSWGSLAPMPTDRSDFGAASLPDGRIVAVGGYRGDNGNGGRPSVVDGYCPFTDQWNVDCIPPTPGASIDDVSLTERNSGTTSFVFTVTLSAASTFEVTVLAQTADGTATVAGNDYVATGPITLIFAPTVTSRTFIVPAVGDALSEPNETFVVSLGSPSNATIARGQGVGTIQNDDGTASLSINDVSLAEGNSGSTSAVFTVTLAPPSGQTVTVVAQTADGTATAGSDYLATGPTTLTFAPGETSETFTVPVLGDTVHESDETFTMSLTSPTGGAVIGRGQATGLLRDEDPVQACAPRPRIRVQPVAGGGKLSVRVEATPLNTQQNNPLKELRFGAFQNARVTLNGQPITGGQAYTTPGGVVFVDFTVERVTAGQPTTVHFTVVDDCGQWPTFVGGGTGAGF